MFLDVSKECLFQGLLDIHLRGMFPNSHPTWLHNLLENCDTLFLGFGPERTDIVLVGLRQYVYL